MEKVMQIIKEPLIWLGISIAVGFIGKKIADKYKGLLYFLISVIELYDEEVADVIPEEVQKNDKYIRIKKLIARILPASMKRTIDNILRNMGYYQRSKNGGNQGYVILHGKPTIGKGN